MSSRGEAPPAKLVHQRLDAAGPSSHRRRTAGTLPTANKKAVPLGDGPLFALQV
jgi:hypothetical protein